MGSSLCNRTNVDRTHPNLYIPFGQTFVYKRTHFIGVHEENIPSNFTSLIKEGIKVEPYEPKVHIPIFMLQAKPDIIFNFEQGIFTYKRVHALDQKTNNPGIGKSTIFGLQ